LADPRALLEEDRPRAAAQGRRAPDCAPDCAVGPSLGLPAAARRGVARRGVTRPRAAGRAQVTQRDVKKLAEKERRQLEEAARLKEAALADDDNVFDVAFEAQGGGADAANTVSATDIKARRRRRAAWVPHRGALGRG
jgi:hypothetical protein